jgi:hypothetical protein
VSYYDDYMRRYSRLNAMRLNQAMQGSTVSTPGPADIAYDVIRRMKAPQFTPPHAEQPQHKGPGGILGFVDKVLPFVAPGSYALMKGLETSPGRAAIDVLSRGNYASANATLEYNKKDREDGTGFFLDKEGLGAIPGAFMKGLTGEAKTTFSDVIKDNDPNASDFKRGALGLAGDIFADPTTYIPVGGLVAAAGKVSARGTKAIRPLETALDAAKETGHVPTSTAQELDKLLTSQAKDIQAVARPKLQITPAPVADQIADVATADTIMSSIKGAPKLQYPGLDIPAPFREIEEVVPEQVVPNVKPAKTEAQQRTLSEARAIKAMILQNPDYRIGKYNVAGILKAAANAEDPARKKIAEKFIDDEVKRVVAEQDYSKLPQRAEFMGRSGEKAPIGLDLEQFTNLIHKGEIGEVGSYSKATDEFTHKFPIHSVDDLSNIFLNNARGERVSLGDYLSSLGVSIKQVSDTGAVKFRKPVQSKLTLSDKAVPSGPKTVKKTVPLNTSEAVLWISRVKGQLDETELAYLQAAKNKPEFEKRLSELKTKTVAGDFKTLDDFIDAANKGVIPKEAVDQILKNVGVKNLKELKSKATKIIQKTGESAPKLTRSTERVPDEFATGAQVTPAEKLVDLPPRTPPAVPETVLQDLYKALPIAVIDNLVDPQDAAKYPWITDIKKSKRTSNTPGQGRARNLHGWHGLSQSDVFRSLVKSASNRHPIPKGIKGRDAFKAWNERAAAMYDEVMPGLAASEFALRKEGVKIISGTDNYGLMLSLTDVLESLPRQLVEKHLFNPRTSVLPTEFLEAADGIVRSLMGQVDVALAKENAVNIFKNSSKIRTLKNPERTAGDLANALMDNSDVIVQRVERNYAEHATEVGTAVKSMTDEVIHNVITKLSDPNVSIGETFGDFAGRYEDISQVGKKINAPTEAYSAAKDAADVSLATVLKPGDFAEARAAKEMAGTTNQKETTKVGVRQQESRAKEAQSLIEESMDLGDNYNAALQGGIFRANTPLLDKAYALKDALGETFVSSYGHAALHEALRVERSVTQDFMRTHHVLMARLHDSMIKVFGPDAKQATQEAFKHVQMGTAVADPRMQAAVDGIKSSIDLSFGSAVDGLGSFAQRNGLVADHLNQMMDYFKAPKQYRFDTKLPFTAQTESWKLWDDVDDPLSLLDIVHASMQRATVEATLGRDFSYQFGRAAKAEGYVKVTDKQGTSQIGKFLDTDLFYPKEIVSQLHYLDRVLKGSIERFDNPNVANMVRKYDSIIHAWKAGLTIYRPGHHVRNLVGDVTLAFLDGVTNPVVYGKAVRVLSRRSKAYDSWDGLKALQEGKLLEGVSDAGNTFVRVNGKRTALTDDQIWRAAYDQGLLPDFRSLEDIAFNAEQSVKFKAGTGVSLSRPLGGKGQRIAGGVSQSRDHMVRIAHFIDIIQKNKYKSLDDAFNAAGARVRKWHPDGSDLTNRENKYLRRGFMFYSWMRKAIPLVVEAMVMRPGRAMVFPKTMYNFAEMNGVDLDSLSNPFPTDQLFPEFITDQILGPQMGQAGDYTGINPGEPITEMTSQWGSSDPQHGLFGAISPVARVPMELMTGTNVGTGTPILDKTDYVDSQIPGLGNIARQTGRSPSSGFLQNTKDVERGNTESGFNTRAFVNDLLGLGIRDYSKPSYIRRGQLEQRNKAREEWNRQHG